MPGRYCWTAHHDSSTDRWYENGSRVSLLSLITCNMQLNPFGEVREEASPDALVALQERKPHIRTTGGHCRIELNPTIDRRLEKVSS